MSIATSPAAGTQQHIAQLAPQRLHHAAWVTPDAARLVDFYTRVLGMELVHSVMDDRVPSTGQAFPYLHIFFRMLDGSTIAFFEAPSIPMRSPSTHPAYEVFDHFAMQVTTRAEIDEWHRRLVSAGIDVVGPTDHGIIYSIYFHDPDGRRLELTTDLDGSWSRQGANAQRDMTEWSATKQAAIAAGQDPAAALLALIHSKGRHS